MCLAPRNPKNPRVCLLINLINILIDWTLWQVYGDLMWPRCMSQSTAMIFVWRKVGSTSDQPMNFAPVGSCKFYAEGYNLGAHRRGENCDLKNSALPTRSRRWSAVDDDVEYMLPTKPVVIETFVGDRFRWKLKLERWIADRAASEELLNLACNWRRSSIFYAGIRASHKRQLLWWVMQTSTDRNENRNLWTIILLMLMYTIDNLSELWYDKIQLSPRPRLSANGKMMRLLKHQISVVVEPHQTVQSESYHAIAKPESYLEVSIKYPDHNCQRAVRIYASSIDFPSFSSYLGLFCLFAIADMPEIVWRREILASYINNYSHVNLMFQ